MRCTYAAIIWPHGVPDADPAWARHLTTCAVCRAEAEADARLQALLAQLPEMAPPAALRDTLTLLDAEVRGQTLTCAQTVDLLEPWREGALERVQAFLVEDHLLVCPTCAQALADSQRLTTLLRTLPALEPPAVIAERIAAARVPWWKRAFRLPSVEWTRQVGLAVGAAAVLLFAVTSMLHTPGTHAPTVAVVPERPTVHPVLPRIAPGPAPMIMATLPTRERPDVRGDRPIDHAPVTVITPQPVIGRPVGYRRTTVHAATLKPELPDEVPALGPPPDEPAYAHSATEDVLAAARGQNLASEEEAYAKSLEYAKLPTMTPPSVTPPRDTPPTAQPNKFERITRSINDRQRNQPSPTLPGPIVGSGNAPQPPKDGTLFVIR